MSLKTVRKKKTLEDDLELLKFLQDHEIKEASPRFNMTEGAVYAWLNRLRKRIVKLQGFLNQVRTMQRISPRIRKLTVIGEVPATEEDAEYFK